MGCASGYVERSKGVQTPMKVRAALCDANGEGLEVLESSNGRQNRAVGCGWRYDLEFAHESE